MLPTEQPHWTDSFVFEDRIYDVKTAGKNSIQENHTSRVNMLMETRQRQDVYGVTASKMHYSFRHREQIQADLRQKFLPPSKDLCSLLFRIRARGAGVKVQDITDANTSLFFKTYLKS